ncbi:choice-of-anchor A domain-containing protein [Paenibacillus sp. PastF-1]|nr:choice-of-anchor A domain-containing protein [Paenibacillus sp. PastF-2]MDF9846748.1 choice-of-anchor A domain-containing protein [Paenibacillus sp. PastM-2]MDF9852903.1 choice-of-anchor A domain-containing protein [Paenibacillus sp. PastF-1]MDH6505910.1 choice-of-anchor A domain-containing protein [Paenibacillus sp. PastM-3]
MMKRMKKKRLYFVSGLALLMLLVLPVWSLLSKIDADQTVYPIRILEVTQDGISQLTSYTSGIPDLTVVTMSMKKFVALRDDLDGQYDALYIGKGAYSPATLGNIKDKSVNERAQAMDTSLIQNDITKLRAGDITNLFINKGLYVIFHDQTFIDKEAQPANARGILYDTFNSLRTSNSKTNVFFWNDAKLTEFSTDLKSSNSRYLAGLKQRPQLQITNSSEIGNYNPAAANGKVYKPGDKLAFNFNISNAVNLANNPLTVKLYINLDKSIAMSEQQVVASAKVNRSNGTLEYTLPRTFSGLLYWKLEISDPASAQQLKDFEQGSIRYRGEKTIVKVLQITPASDQSNLTSAANMQSAYLNKEDYELQIKTMTMANFNTYIKDTYTATGQYGLNGVYDMLLFGFRDEYYKYAILSSQAITAVKDFIEVSKQSAMFTHDTVINIYGDNTWVSNFKNITGQKEPVVNFGHNALNMSTKVKPVNDGLLMQYPFYLSKQDASGAQVSIAEPKVAPTHNQYFTLDLEDREVIPWYNILSESNNALGGTSNNTYKRTPDDSWNHYYTYSKGNVTYSGTGHLFGSGLNSSLAVFPDWEQQLFVNTMYRAFMGANHAPQITVYTPAPETVIPSYQDKLTVSYSVADLDFKDRTLTTGIKFMVNNQELTDMTVTGQQIFSEEVVTKTFRNPLPEGGNVEIVITAKDAQGAMVSTTIPVTIRKADASLSISRNQSATTIEKGKSVTIDYSISPNVIKYNLVQTDYRGKQSLVISNLQYVEHFPANLEFSGTLPDYLVKTGTLQEGYTITGTFPDITYNLATDANGEQYYKPVNPADSTVPLAYKFTLTAVPQEKKSYIMDNSKITFNEIHAPALPAATATPIATAESTPTPTPTPTPAPTPTPIVFPGSSEPITSLGVAKDYSIYMLEDIDYSPTSFQNKGRTAAGGSITAQGLTLGGGLPANQTGPVLIAGKNIDWGNWGGSINGKAYYGGTVKAPDYLLKNTEQNSTFPFAKVNESLIKLSAYLATLPGIKVDAVIANDRNDFTVTGTDPKLNVFYVTLKDNSKYISAVKVDAPADSTVVINVVGTSAKFGNGSITLVNVKPNNVLFNFYQATSVLSESYAIKESILAPNANIQLTGTYEGTIIGRKLSPVWSNGVDITYAYPFTGSWPAMPAPEATTAPTTTPDATATPAPTVAPTLAPTATPLPLIPVTMNFSRIDLEAIVKVSSINLTGGTILVNTTLKLLPEVLPDDANNKDVDWRIVEGSSIVNIDSAGLVTGLTEGTATIVAVARDGSNVTSNTAVIKVENPVPVRTVTISANDGLVNQPINLTATYNSTQTETDIKYSWEVKDSNGNLLQNLLSGANQNPAIFTATQSGSYTITVTVTSSSNTQGTPASYKINITNPLTDFTINSKDYVMMGKSIDLTLSDFKPNNADHYQISWSLPGTGNHYAQLTKAEGDTDNTKYTLMGTAATDSLTVTVTAGTITKTKVIKILQLTSMAFSKDVFEITVGGAPLDLNKELWFMPRDITIDDVRDKLKWEITYPGIASFADPVTVDNQGIIFGKQKGSTLVTVTYDSDPNNPDNPVIKASTLIKVVPLTNDDRY